MVMKHDLFLVQVYLHLCVFGSYLQSQRRSTTILIVNFMTLKNFPYSIYFVHLTNNILSARTVSFLLNIVTVLCLISSVPHYLPGYMI